MLDARADSNKTEIMLARVEELARAKARTATRLNKAATFVSGIAAISATAIGVTKPEGWQIYIACLALALLVALAYSVFEAKDVTDHYFDLRDAKKERDAARARAELLQRDLRDQEKKLETALRTIETAVVGLQKAIAEKDGYTLQGLRPNHETLKRWMQLVFGGFHVERWMLGFEDHDCYNIAIYVVDAKGETLGVLHRWTKGYEPRNAEVGITQHPIGSFYDNLNPRSEYGYEESLQLRDHDQPHPEDPAKPFFKSKHLHHILFGNRKEDARARGVFIVSDRAPGSLGGDLVSGVDGTPARLTAVCSGLAGILLRSAFGDDRELPYEIGRTNWPTADSPQDN